MENKINVAELLKDCPKGMELDCAMYEGAELDCVTNEEGYPIKIIIKDNTVGNVEISLTKEGCYNLLHSSKCVIFPKGKTSWKGFKPPCKFKEGDIVVTTLSNIAIIKKPTKGELYCVYGLMVYNGFYIDEAAQVFVKRLATEEEKQKLFAAIKANGYKWNAETKTLEKLIVPKFKAGDKIIKNNGIYIFDVVLVSSEYYTIKGFGSVYEISIKEQDSFKLAPNKFDINTLKPFESKVLVRDHNTQNWTGAFYSSYDVKDNYPFHYPFRKI